MKKTGKVFIYGLKCPISNRIRYIGKSINPTVRLAKHLYRPEIEANTHKARWLRLLLTKKLMPILVIIEIINEKEWEDKEKFWIAKLNGRGFKLTNETQGGNGREKGFKHKPEAVQKIQKALRCRHPEIYRKAGIKISESLKGRPLSREHKRQISIAHKKRWQGLTPQERYEGAKNLRHDWSQQSRKKLLDTNRGKIHKNRTSEYIGVCWFKRDQCWRSYIVIDGRQKHLGYFDSEIEAAIAYNNEVKLHREFTKLNVV